MAEWILSKAFFHYVRMKKKSCSPFTLSPQRHLFKLLALLDVKNVVVKAHTVNCSSLPCQHEPLLHRDGGTRVLSLPETLLGWAVCENRQWVVHEEEEAAFHLSWACLL